LAYREGDIVRKILLAILGFVAVYSTAGADEGMWLFTHPPRKLLKENYSHDLTDALLERLQKASVMVGGVGSGAFVSADGLIVTNQHVGLDWLQQLSEKGPDIVSDGFYADQRSKELRCTGLEVRAVWSMEDITARVHAAIKPDMTLAQVARAREKVLRTIEGEARKKTSLDCEAVCHYYGGRYHLYRYKKYTDVRLVFAPEEGIAPLLDVCFFRAYEMDRPAKVAHHLAGSAAPLGKGDLVLASGYPGATDRFRTAAELEDLYGPQFMLRFKAICRLNNGLAQFAGADPDNERHARAEAAAVDNEVGSLLSSLETQEKLIAQIRMREDARQAALVCKDAKSAKQRQQALERIAACVKDGSELSQSYFFLESSYAFKTYLFDYARDLVRLADESAKPDADRLLEYSRAYEADVKRGLLEPKTIVKEMEIVKLAESLDLFVRYAGPDAALAAKVLDGKTARERARALIEGSQLDQVEVRKHLLQGGGKALADSKDPMLALARLVDARSRQVRKELEEKISEPCLQAHAALRRIQEQAGEADTYPDANGSLRLSFGAVQQNDALKMMKTRGGIVTIGTFLRFVKESGQEKRMPPNWQQAMDQLNEEAPLLFMTSADLVPGSSGSPVVDRQGRLVGVAAWVPNAAHRLAYIDGESGSGAIAAHGIAEVLDKVYHAGALVKELGYTDLAQGKKNEGPVPSARVLPSGLLVPKAGVVAPMPIELPPVPLLPSPAPSEAMPAPTQSGLLQRMFEKPATLAERNKELVPALMKALKDSDPATAQAAATALGNLGSDALPALTEALQGKDKVLRARAALALGKLGRDGESAVAVLLKALEDEVVEVRREAARALAAIAESRGQGR
jgi:hypothetical protein